MPDLYPRSLTFVASLPDFLSSAILFILRRSVPSTIGSWGRGLVAMALARGRIGLTSHIPDFLSVILVNLMPVGDIMKFLRAASGISQACRHSSRGCR